MASPTSPTFVIESGTDTEFEVDTEDEQVGTNPFQGSGHKIPKPPPGTNLDPWWKWAKINEDSAAGKKERAKTAIEKLSQPASKPKKTAADPTESIVLPKWTKDKQSLLTSNLNVLMETTRKREAAAAQNTLVLRNAQGQGVKRQRNFTAQGQAAGGRQQKRLRLNPQTQMRGPANVFELPKPIRIIYNAIPSEDGDDKFYTAMFKRLQADIEAFVEGYFIVRDLDAGEGFNPWGLDWSPEFINWAKIVAEDDPHCGGWENLMRNSIERKWFLCAIIHRVIHAKIFDVNLWGGTTEQSKVMDGMAFAMLNDEGFRRTALRAQTVKTFLHERAVTENFYQDVANLNAQMFLLFEPLTSYLSRLPEDGTGNTPAPENQYQSMHNIISSAAFLSLCIRQSPTIFWFIDMSPGSLFDRGDQMNADSISYTKSKQTVYGAYNIARKKWEADKKAIDREVTSKVGQGPTRDFKRAKARQLAITASTPRSPPIDYRAMTKIGISPMITRYKPGSKDDDEAVLDFPCNPKPLHLKNGFRDRLISQASVVCYYGRNDRQGHVDLEDFVEEKMNDWILEAETLPLGLDKLGKKSAIATTVGLTAMGLVAYAFHHQITEATGFPFNFGEAVEFVGDLVKQFRQI